MGIKAYQHGLPGMCNLKDTFAMSKDTPWSRTSWIVR